MPTPTLKRWQPWLLAFALTATLTLIAATVARRVQRSAPPPLPAWAEQLRTARWDTPQWTVAIAHARSDPNLLAHCRDLLRRSTGVSDCNQLVAVFQELAGERPDLDWLPLAAELETHCNHEPGIQQWSILIAQGADPCKMLTLALNPALSDRARGNAAMSMLDSDADSCDIPDAALDSGPLVVRICLTAALVRRGRTDLRPNLDALLEHPDLSSSIPHWVRERLQQARPAPP